MNKENQNVEYITAMWIGEFYLIILEALLGVSLRAIQIFELFYCSTIINIPPNR